jgi:hypothetical protein
LKVVEQHIGGTVYKVNASGEFLVPAGGVIVYLNDEQSFSAVSATSQPTSLAQPTEQPEQNEQKNEHHSEQEVVTP